MLCGIPFPLMITVCVGVDGDAFITQFGLVFLITDFQDISERNWGVLIRLKTINYV